MLVEMIAERKKFFAAQRAAEQRSKPPTKTQIRNRMCTYLKNMEVVKSSVTRTEGSSKRARDELESDKSKKQKIDEHVEAKKDDDQEEAEMKKHIEIVKDDEVAIDVIPLATKPPMIVEYKINIDREDLETLWKLVKAKHGNTRLEEDYERVLWGDLKMMNIKFRGGLLGLKDFKMILRVTAAQLQLLSDYYYWKDYADRDEINNLSEKR
ncbi:hypothetical protein Tco_1345013 [Tanacetum coccineum]